ncbi:MAG: antibiotic biosynthesis monooxygenase [Devosia sp.]
MTTDQRVVRIAELEIVASHLADYKALLAEEITASIEREPGVLMLHAVAIKTAPHHIHLLEVYASKAAYEAHIQTPHFLKYKTATAAMVASLRLIDVAPVVLAAK